MYLVSGPDLVREACKSGIMAVLPSKNAQDLPGLDAWLTTIFNDLHIHVQEGGSAGPLAVNISSSTKEEELGAYIDLCARHGVRVIVTAGRDPTPLARMAHDAGLLVFHDVTTVRFAEKAISAGVDGLNCIGAGGGGHSGILNSMVFVRKLRAMFSGTIVLGGAISDGASIRAAQALGADLAYMGTRFIATHESMAPNEYKKMLVESTSKDLVYTSKVAGVYANWLVPSLNQVGLDPANLPQPTGVGRRYDHLPKGALPWRTIWSAGQGIDLIHDIPTVRELVERLRTEYASAWIEQREYEEVCPNVR